MAVPVSRRWLVLLVLAGLFGWWAAAERHAPATQPEDVPRVDLSKAKYFGASACKDCHSKDTPNDFVRLDEYRTWHTKDKHSLAYEVLTQTRAQQMGKLLGCKPTETAACLNCHTANVPGERRADSFELADGVSCDSCHGPAQHWFGEHIQRSWRLRASAEKEALGMFDMRNPRRRAQVCIACHVGNAAEGKVVTHDMYAAGHPPLPGFELATFSNALPRHWRLMRDVPFLQRPKLEKPPRKELKDPAVLQQTIWQLYHYDSAAHEETRAVVIGGLAVFQEAMELLAHQAKAVDPKSAVLDLANFNCFACHHDLKSPGWRQKAAASGAPGRPPLPTWTAALVRLGIRQAAGTDEKLYDRLRAEYQDLLKELHAHVSSKPFGEPAKASASAAKLAAWSKGLLAEVSKRKVDQPAAQRLLKELAQAGQAPLLDYDTARQIAWATRIIAQEVHPQRHILQELDKELLLTLPVGKYSIADKTLPAMLLAINRYEPKNVVRCFKEFAMRLE